MSDELTDTDPFSEGKTEPDLISVPMIKKATFHMHALAKQRNEKFEEIRDKCRKLFGYTNLAKVTVEDGHKIINKLIELTGGEEEEQGAGITDGRTEHKEVINETTKKQEAEHDPVTATMRASVRAAVDITLKEIVAKEVPVQGLGGVVLEISKVIFEAKMSKEASK